MKHWKLFLAVLVTAIITFAATSHHISRNSWKYFAQASSSMEAFNEIHRIESWDEMEQLLVKGCTKEALEYARVQQSLGLSSLKYHLNQGAKLEAQVEELNRATLSRARTFSSKGRYDLPICK